MADYIPILVLLVLSGGFATVSVIAARILSPKDPSAAKLAPYECGITEIDEVSERFPVRFYQVAMLFVIFDVEVILMFPWAVAFDRFRVFALVEMSVFIAVLLVAYVYVWKKGALDWD